MEFLTTIATTGALFLIALQLATYIYNLTLHPLRRFPGPLACKASTLPIIHEFLRGNGIFWITDLHKRYGPVVRISPNELSFNSVEAFKDIYGFQKGRPDSLPKDPDFYEDIRGTRHIMNSDTANHARQRRMFAPAFSVSALKLQGPLFLACADRLIAKIRERIKLEAGCTHDMVKLYTCTVADTMSDFVFGESMNNLDDTSYHPWLATTLDVSHQGVYMKAIRYYKLLTYIIEQYSFSESVDRQIKTYTDFAEQRIKSRLEAKTTRPDLWGLALERDSDGTAMSREEIVSNSIVFMVGGVETTSTLLSFLTYHLLAHPKKMERLASEIRDAVEDEGDITIDKLQDLAYLNACIEEGLRLFPPTPGAPPRVTPAGHPTIIDGFVIPQRTKVAVPIMAAARNPRCWSQPDLFVPERWLDDSSQSHPWDSDNRQSSQPFLLGRRGCIGKNTAYHVIRVILFKIFWNFDLSLSKDCRDWTQQKNYFVWMKPPLNCYLHPRKPKDARMA